MYWSAQEKGPWLLEVKFQVECQWFPGSVESRVFRDGQLTSPRSRVMSWVSSWSRPGDGASEKGGSDMSHPPLPELLQSLATGKGVLNAGDGVEPFVGVF